MKADKLNRLQKKLLQEGIAYRHVQRCLRELRDHYDDLFVQAKVKGLSDQTAACLAEQELGDLDVVAQEMAQCSALKSLGSRFPRTIFLLLPFLTYVTVIIGALLLLAFVMDRYFPSELVAVNPPPDWLIVIVEYVLLFFMHMFAPLISCWTLGYGLRQQIAKKLLYSGVVLLNLFACALLLNVNWPDPQSRDPEGTIGAVLGYGFYDIRGVMDSKIRFLVTMVALLMFAFVYRRRLFGNKQGW